MPDDDLPFDDEFGRVLDRRAIHWKLDGKLAVPCKSLLEWALWFQNADRTVAKTQVGGLEVSTIFLGIDHNFWDHGPPLLFETMIFSIPGEEGYTCRYATWVTAEAGHAKAVEWAQRKIEEIQKQLNQTNHPAAMIENKC